MHEFQRSVRHREFVRSLAETNNLTGGVADLLLKSEKDDRGTIAAMAREIDEAAADGKWFTYDF